MALNDVPPDPDPAMSIHTIHAGYSRHGQKHKKRGEHFFYVSADSAEADTLKDKFWRDLDQGKLAFDNTEDLYTRVKRGAKKAPCTLRLNITQQQDAIASAETAGTENSAGCGLAEVGYLSGNTAVIDASTPASSGYESSSIPSVGPVTAANSPADAALSQSVLCGLVDLRLEAPDIKPKLVKHSVRKKCHVLKQSALRKAGRTALHKAKRGRRKFRDFSDISCANMKPIGRFTSHKNENGKPQCHVFESSSVAFSNLGSASRTMLWRGRGRKRRRKFYELVDASSAEADTLKDKFWRDLEMGRVNITTSSDLYSSVKVSRNQRPRAVSMVSNESRTVFKTMRSPVLENDSLSFSHTEGPVVEKSGTVCWDKALNPSASDNNRCCKLKEEASDKCTSVQQRLPDDVVEQWPTVNDSKLQSPCAVAVERLPLVYRTVGGSFVNNDNSAGYCSTKCHVDSHHRNVFGADDEVTKNIKIMKNISVKRARVSRLTCSKHCHPPKRKFLKETMGHDSCNLPKEIYEMTEYSSTDDEPEREVAVTDVSSDKDGNSGLIICTDPDKPCGSLFSLTGWLSCEEEPVCVQSKGSLHDLIRRGDCASIRLLLSHQSLPIDDLLHSPDSDGLTCIMLAASYGCYEVMSVLAQFGANVNAQSCSGITALMIACEKGHKRVVETLIGLGAQMELQTTIGETALMKAVRNGHSDVVELLLSRGADTAVVSHCHETSFSIARHNQHLDHVCNVLDNHATRRLNALHSAVGFILRGIVTIVDALFPLHCFCVNEVDQQFTVRFHFSQDFAPSDAQPLLFIGHAEMGEHSVDCRLQGSCAIKEVRLNGIQLVPLGEDENFVFLCQPLCDDNNLVLHVQHHRQHSKVKLLVCAYFVKPSKADCHGVVDGVCSVPTSISSDSLPNDGAAPGVSSSVSSESMPA